VCVFSVIVKCGSSHAAAAAFSQGWLCFAAERILEDARSGVLADSDAFFDKSQAEKRRLPFRDKINEI